MDFADLISTNVKNEMKRNGKVKCRRAKSSFQHKYTT